jgi:glycosyltransferase involved in cell wall biosynthesis
LTTADAVGGVWRYTLDLGRAMRARGIRTTAAVMGPAPTDAQRHEARDAGDEIVERPYRLEWMDDPWSDVERAGAWLLDLERRLRPSVVHLNGYAHAALPWRGNVVVVAHSCVRTWWKAVKYECAPSSMHRYTAAVTAGLRAARQVVAPTTAMGAALQAEYDEPTRVHTIPNGCAPAPPFEDLCGHKQPIVLAAGRAWDEAKNIGGLCAIADSLDWPVYVAGEQRGPGGQACALPAVRLLGQLSRIELEQWYRRAAIYALPARYEPFGLSVLEAAAAGCALVLGDIPSLRENWQGAAVFVPPEDRTALASALTRLIDRPAERRALSRRAHARAAAFTIDRTAADYLRVYRMLSA